MADIISNAKVFIDFGTTSPAAGLQALAGGAIWLQFLDQMKVSDGRSVEVKTVIGKKRGGGFKRKPGGGTLMLTENRHNPQQVNWAKLKRDESIFMIMVQDENGGTREKFLSCTVSKYDESKSSEGEHQDEIEIAFLDSV